ncbi:hypothetical protein BN77_p30042 [Rhizobium mesoamericanum STM3625]|uniref:Uncharacterized protein n=1 Tax=Rhizobium mesoamericanum STM3625 TaxID=1211777 RepID=K0Q007_9HYPH|nr:hypothetical protein BN77_p30042 [Rhizobium mesoamericanum STM3625]
MAYLSQAGERLVVATNPSIESWQIEACHYRPLIERIISQSETRVLVGDTVPAGNFALTKTSALDPVHTSKTTPP